MAVIHRVGSHWFCNWHGSSQSLSRGPNGWDNDDYQGNLIATIGGYNWHFAVRIEATYYNVSGNWYVKSDCDDGTPAQWNNEGDWERDYNNDSYFQNCDTCPSGRLKMFYYCFPAYGSVTVINSFWYPLQPAFGATIAQAWFNNTGDMLRPFSNPAPGGSGAWVVYSKRYDTTNCPS